MKKQEKLELINDTLLSKENASVEDYKGNKIYTYTKLGRFVAGIVEKGKSKLTNHISYDNLLIRTIAITDFKSTIDYGEKKEADYLVSCNEQKALIKVGSILYESWGYEQTNIDFLLVLSRSKDTVEVVRVGQFKTYDQQDSGSCTPNIKKHIGEPFKKRLSKYGSIKINSFSDATLYDGKPLYWSSYY